MKAADAYLIKAIGQGALPEAHLLRAQALAEQALPRLARQEMADPLRALWAELEERIELESADRGPSLADQLLTAVTTALPELAGLEPASSQDPLPLILRRVGESAEQSFTNFTNTSSAERIRMERLRRNGKVAESREENFRYLPLVSPDQPDAAIREYRTNRRGAALAPSVLSQKCAYTSGPRLPGCGPPFWSKRRASGLGYQFPRNAAASSPVLAGCDARRSRRSVRVANQRSTRLIQDDPVGVKCQW